MTATRRQLRFASLDEAVRDAEMLLANGYTKTGNWDLVQVCNHLSDWLSYPMDGFPPVPLFLRPIFWALRNTIGRRKLETYIREQSFPAGKPTMPQTVHAPGEDERAAVTKLRDTVARFMAYTGTMHPSPVFGMLDKDTLVKLHCIHTAHHLSFLTPKT